MLVASILARRANTCLRQAELFQKQKLSSGTINNRLAALRFFYIKTLKKAWSIAETPYPKKAFHLPSILSQEEVTQLIG
jgi:integrase/recombinase XerD